MGQPEHYLKKELYHRIASDAEIFGFIQKSSLDGLWYWDLEEPKNEWMSPEFWTTLGYEPTDMSHCTDAWQNIIFPEDLALAQESITRHLADPTYSYDQDVRYRHKNGSVVWVRCRGMAIRDGEGKPTRMLGAHIDITSLKEKEEELEKAIYESDSSHQELQSFLDDANDLIQSVDTQGNYLYVNRAWCNILGYTAKEVKKITIFDVIDPTHQAHCKALFEQLVKDQKPILAEVLFRSKSGDPVYVEGHISGHILGEDQIITRGIFRDVTQRRKAESELKRTREFLEQTNTVAQVGGWEVDLVHKIVTWTKTTRDIHEVEASYIPELNAGISFYKEGYSRDAIQQVVDRAIQKGEAWDVELQIITAKDNERWVRAIGRAEFQENVCIRLYGTFQDIDDQKKKEIHQKLLESVVTHANDAVIITESRPDKPSESPIIYVNESFCQITGYSQDEVIGKNPLILQGPATDLQELKRLREALSAGESVELNTICYKKSGEQYWASFSVVPVTNYFVNSHDEDHREKQSTHWVTIKRDITKQKLFEERLLQATAQAEAANVAKSEFLANMSHEIRTPLNGVIGFTDLLMKTKLDEQQFQCMQSVQHSANTLLELINDILDFSKIEAGKLELSEERCWLRKILKQVTDIFALKAKEKEVELHLNLNPELPQYVWVDPVRLRQILTNLIGNALKFTEDGKIEVSVNPIPGQNDNEKSCLEFSVQDSGVGIDPNRQQAIFNAFDQEDTSTTRKYGGTGLGLTISNQLLGLMGSQMELESEPGVGSRFFFKIHLKAESDLRLPVRKLPAVQHVLIVSDNLQECRMIQDILTTIYVTFDVAHSIEEATKELNQNTYSLLILDDHLLQEINPGTDEIRERLGVDNTGLPVILLRDNNQDNTLDHSTEIQTIITKPVTSWQLIQALFREDLVDQSQTAPPVQPEERMNQPISILIVDDNIMNRKLARVMLQQILPNATFQDAEDGKEAVQKFREHNADIILMDIQMPMMSGYEASQRIRKLDKGSQVVIIALTARTVKGERERCLDAGMDDYLSKPFVIDTLRDKLYQWGKQEQEPKSEPKKEEAETSLMHFDLAKCKASMCIDDDEIISELFKEFFEQLEEDLPELRNAYEDQDLETLRKIAHKHKSSSKMMNTEILAALMVDLENQESFDRDIIQPLIEQIEQESHQVKALVNRALGQSNPLSSTNN